MKFGIFIAVASRRHQITKDTNILVPVQDKKIHIFNTSTCMAILELRSYKSPKTSQNYNRCKRLPTKHLAFRECIGDNT